MTRKYQPRSVEHEYCVPGLTVGTLIGLLTENFGAEHEITELSLASGDLFVTVKTDTPTGPGEFAHGVTR